ncbi:MAG: hypothetical protein ABEK10_00580 [Candidatus Nanosalina sp.]
MSVNEPYWKGNATEEKFSIKRRELEETIRLREEWLQEIELSRENGDVEIQPRGKDARRNSKASGDHNLLHNNPDVVEDVAKEYGFVRRPTEDKVVVNQGMSLVDALVTELDAPINSIEGEWEKMVYAAEEGETDTVKLSNEGSGKFSAELYPAGVSESLQAGEISFGYAEEGDYHSEHNEYMAALADQAVGRGFENPDIRNGELLISNELEAYGSIDWDKAEEFVFNLSEVDERGHKVTADWDIDVIYDEGSEESAISYVETSMYADGFEELEAVMESGKDSPFSAYMRASLQAAMVASEASMMPLRVGTSTMNGIAGSK